MSMDDQANEAPINNADESPDRAAAMADDKPERSGLVHSINKFLTPRTITTLFILALPLIYFFPAVKGQIVLMMGDGLVYGYLMRVLTGDLLAIEAD